MAQQFFSWLNCASRPSVTGGLGCRLSIHCGPQRPTCHRSLTNGMVAKFIFAPPMCHRRWNIFKVVLRSQKTRSKFLCEPFQLTPWKFRLIEKFRRPQSFIIRREIETFDGVTTLLRTSNTSRALERCKSTSSRIITAESWGRKVLCQEKGNICAVFPLPSPSSASLSAMLSDTNTNKAAEESVFKWLYLKEAFDVASAQKEEETRSSASGKIYGCEPSFASLFHALWLNLNANASPRAFTHQFPISFAAWKIHNIKLQ